MAKIKFKYDKENDVFYYLANRDKKTINIPFDDDIVTRIDPKEMKVIGLIISNFSIEHPKLAKTVGTKNEEFVIMYFELWLNSLNDVIEKVRESITKKNVFKKFITGTKMKIKDGNLAFK